MASNRTIIGIAGLAASLAGLYLVYSNPCTTCQFTNSGAGVVLGSAGLGTAIALLLT